MFVIHEYNDDDNNVCYWIFFRQKNKNKVADASEKNKIITNSVPADDVTEEGRSSPLAVIT